MELAPESQVELTRRQTIRNFTTRMHYAGRHRVTLLVNGKVMAEAWFDLSC